MIVEPQWMKHLHVVWKRSWALARRAMRPVVRKGLFHWLRFAALLAAGSYLGHVLSESQRFADLRYSLYQKQVRIEHRQQVYPQRTVLVLLNDEDYWSDTYQARSPYKRDQLALLLNKLDGAGATIVGFDINLSSPFAGRPDYDFPDYRRGDSLFLDAMRTMCANGRHVILVNSLTGYGDPPYHRQPTLYDTVLPSLPCVSLGHDGLPDDMRKIAGSVLLDNGRYLDSFSLSMVRLVDRSAYRRLTADSDRGFRFGNYLTPKDFSPIDGRQFVFNGKAVESMSLAALRDAIADRIVIVGGSYSSSAYGVGDYVDTHDSPGGVESGAMLHANYVEAELNQDSTFTPISDNTAELLEWVLAFLLALIGSLEIPGIWKWGSVFSAFAFSLLLTYVLMQNVGFFLDFFIPFLMIVIHTVTEEMLEVRHELKHAKRLLRERSL